MPRLTRPTDDTTSLTLGEASLRWATHLRIANKTEATRAQYAYAMKVLVERLPAGLAIDAVTRSDIEGVVAALADRWKPASVSSVFRPWRSFWKWAAEHPDVPVERDVMAGMEAPAVQVEQLQYPTPAEVSKVLATCKSRSRHNFRGTRDEAILRLFASTGARLAEVTGLRVEDVDLVSSLPTVSVLGKGRKWRTLPLDVDTTEALRRWMRERSRSPFAKGAAVWLGPQGPMTPSGIAQMVTARGTAVGVSLHPHAFRHFAIDSMLRAGMQEGDVMGISGHTSRSMMDRYGRDRRSERARDAFLKAALPRL